MHITGGKFKGKKIKSINKIRPTMSKVREAFFNICREKIEKAFFLDLFAGSGIMGLEALSRGASYVVFVEKDIKVVRCIRENICSLQVEKFTDVIKEDIFVALQKIKMSFDIIYFDPPFKYYEDKNFLNKIIISLEKSFVLKKNSYIFFEAPKNVEIPYMIKDVKEKKYGGSSLFFLKK
ncbi:MAG: hypothetical protein AMS24_02975 [Chlamydiae bacterium SM23_39]|nr:MAG: hypothetical protein AMS24_02975 [Chlamydiae bacterium SM23_39]